jgi:hypothetical protein
MTVFDPLSSILPTLIPRRARVRESTRRARPIPRYPRAVAVNGPRSISPRGHPPRRARGRAWASAHCGGRGGCGPQSSLIARSWAGGEKGREVVDRVLERLDVSARLTTFDQYLIRI